MAGYTKRPYSCSICGGRHGKHHCPQNPQNSPQVEEDVEILDVAFHDIRNLFSDLVRKIAEQQRENDLLWERVNELESVEQEYKTLLKIMDKARKEYADEGLKYVVDRTSGEVRVVQRKEDDQ